MNKKKIFGLTALAYALAVILALALSYWINSFVINYVNFASPSDNTPFRLILVSLHAFIYGTVTATLIYFFFKSSYATRGYKLINEAVHIAVFYGVGLIIGQWVLGLFIAPAWGTLFPGIYFALLSIGPIIGIGAAYALSVRINLRMQSQKKLTKNNKNKELPVLTIVGVAIVMLLLGLVANSYIQNNRKEQAIKEDKLRFSEVERKKSLLIDELAGRLGNRVASIKEDNQCFNTEQGPFDNGNLWCQTATVVKLKSDIDLMEFGNTFIEVAKSQNLQAGSSNNYDVPRFWFNTETFRTCNLNAIDPKGNEISGATRRVLNESDAPAFAISCSDRAKAKHYPYF